MDQLVASHKSRIDDLNTEHAAALESKVKALEKTISNQSLELKATQDDLAKAKSALAASVPELEAWKKKADDAEKALSDAFESSASDHAAVVKQLSRDLAAARDDKAALEEGLEAQKNMISEIVHNHSTELENAAKTRVDEVTKLRAGHEEEKAALINDRNSLTERVSDLEGELATLRATVASQTTSPSPKSNGHAPLEPTISKEDLQKLHEAHNLKLGDVEAEHQKAVSGLREELGTVAAKSNALQDDVNRKTYEVELLERENDEKDDDIARYVKKMNDFVLSKFLPIPKFFLHFFRVDRDLPV